MSYMSQIIKLKLKSFDHRILDGSTKAIFDAVKRTGASVRGPIPLPVKKTIHTINRSTHVNKTSREQLEIRRHARLLIIENASPGTIDGLMSYELPSGVEVEIKLDEEK